MHANLMAEPITYLGVTVTPEALETEIAGQSYLTLNGAEGHALLLERLGQIAGSVRIVCEKAGGAETTLVQALRAAGFTVGIAATESVCAFARLSDASQITPSNLTHYAIRHPGQMKFMEGSLMLQNPTPGGATTFKSQLSSATDSRRSAWVSFVKMLANWWSPKWPGAL
jgi:hypothetical protein